MSGCIDDVILKLAARCNLNCSYCYVYNHEDKSYRARPKFLSEELFEHTLAAIGRYCERRDGHRMGIMFHGGEPTLIGARRFDRLAQRAKEALGERLAGLAIQTNGMFIDDDWLEVLARHEVSVGVSLDGPAQIHDLVRVDHRGRGSHAATVAGLRRLQHAQLGVFVLTVVNPGQSGLRTYRYFRELGIEDMDFLLPDVSHDNKQRWYGQLGPTPVADYLLPIFDRWMEEDRPEVKVRLFVGLLRAMLGGSGETDGFGNPKMGYLIVETDGSIEALDALRVCDAGIQRSGLNVREHGFDDLAAGLPLVHQLVHEGIALPAACRGCAEREICGGGYLPHRYARARGFDNPSVWCADILKLLEHMRRAVGSLCAA
jgi:uncharacterized protein